MQRIDSSITLAFASKYKKTYKKFGLSQKADIKDSNTLLCQFTVCNSIRVVRYWSKPCVTLIEQSDIEVSKK